MMLRLAKGIHWGAVYGLLATAGCPQMKRDDFAAIEGAGGGDGDAGVTIDCSDGVAVRGCAGGGSAGSATFAPDAGDAGADAGEGSGGAAGSDAGSNTPADAGPACESDAVRGPDGDCYFADPTVSTWNDARTSCQQRGEGWDLAALHGTAENDFVVALTGYEAWLGGTDLAEEGTWLWVRDGESFFEVGADPSTVFTPWSADEPNDFEDSDCLRVLTTGLWADWDCEDGAYGHVCQRELP
jgi:lectin-like protein